jgi:hypothetical protein
MRRVGVSQDDQDHLASNPRKLTHHYLEIIFLRYRVLSPAPLTARIPPLISQSEGRDRDLNPGQRIHSPLGLPLPHLGHHCVIFRLMDRPGFGPGAYGYVISDIISTMPTWRSSRLIYRPMD